ncbi:MAG: NUDIX domain-containing protein [Alphaproteobacteria bacterium]
MDRDDVEIIEKTAAFEGYFRIDRYRLRHKRFEGGWTDEMTREVFERGHAVAVLPYDPARDSLVLIEQFRIGAYAEGRAPWLVEVVAGIIEEGEDPEEVARRETLEETGCTLLDLVPVANFLVSPGGTTQSVKLYCGRVDASRAGGIHGLAHEHEDIRVFVEPAARIPELLASSAAGDATTILSLQWLMLNRDAIRWRWAAPV